MEGGYISLLTGDPRNVAVCVGDNAADPLVGYADIGQRILGCHNIGTYQFTPGRPFSRQVSFWFHITPRRLRGEQALLAAM